MVEFRVIKEEIEKHQVQNASVPKQHYNDLIYSSPMVLDKKINKGRKSGSVGSQPNTRIGEIDCINRSPYDSCSPLRQPHNAKDDLTIYFERSFRRFTSSFFSKRTVSRNQ